VTGVQSCALPIWVGLLVGRWSASGHGLRHWLDRGDLIGARRTVNGTDKADLIAGHHRAFLAAITEAAGWRSAPAPRTPEALPALPPPAPRPWWARLFDVFRSAR